jgi:hypothetical protein
MLKNRSLLGLRFFIAALLSLLVLRGFPQRFTFAVPSKSLPT